MIYKIANHRWTILLACVVGMSGCVSSNMSDLEQQVQEILKRPGGRIEPLPEIKPYEAYVYQSGHEGARDPFELFYKQKATVAEKDENAGLTEEQIKEVRYRNREELESFELDSLRMVGTLEDQNTQWGIVRDPNGTVHRVKVGNYMGTNIGKILNIFEDRIELREIIRNPEGRWIERDAARALAEK